MALPSRGHVTAGVVPCNGSACSFSLHPDAPFSGLIPFFRGISESPAGSLQLSGYILPGSDPAKKMTTWSTIHESRQVHAGWIGLGREPTAGPAIVVQARS